ncbi:MULTISPECIES: Mu transposase C-terminal domain-containing protein [Bacillaceae]|uniref:DDE-type integrase/transposase/recombinase n=1 Tax=Cytobacillus stercorigallinarum TaxID=2762240 RepID=A0ABR8QPY9_9BACI|nr:MULTISPECIES: Mu transposase C-terminal domain-containing protein [Bacillaceae]MBD7937595.1 DDE-type integrase/transposase/recombinase [Cytobacillus stercorigallinarum]MCM3363007.1 transposase family protein [Niallia sp. MER TA 168]MCM3443710.1 transposase family protein [Metabacillus halosaccharovorans]
MQLVINDLLQSTENPEFIQRVVWVDNEHQLCFLVNVREPSFPYSEEIHSIESSLIKGEITKVATEPWAFSVKEEDLSGIEIEKRDKAWIVINQIYLIPDIFIPKRRSELIKMASKDFFLSTKTIRQYLKRYWSRGMVKNALLPDFNKCGKQQGKERKYIKKAGRPFAYSSSIQRAAITDEWKKIIRISLEKYYFIRSKPSLKYAYQQMVKEYFSKEDEKSGYKVLDLDKPIISYDQFYYWYRKWYKPEDAIHKREGRREFLQNYRAITGSATEDSMGIGTYAIDATIGDVYLVSSFDRNIVIGRPVIYLTVDIFSRCIVSVYAGIQNMSKESLRLALANAFEDKKEFCKRTLDMDIDENDWPIHYLPHTILADRGSELISNELTQITADLNIKIQNLGPYRPELKAVCEKYFDILQDHISPFLPGAVQKDFMKRGGKDYRKKAVLNLNEYVQILVRTVLYYNNHNYLSDYPLTQSMIAEKVPPIPIEIFKWGLRKGTGLLRTMPLDAIRSSVLPKASAKITPKGINFGGLYYTCAKALKERWFSKARIKGSWSMGVHYDPQDVSNIYIRIDRLNYEVCSLIEQYEMYRGVKMEEVVSLKTERKQQEAEYEESSLNGAIQLAQDIEEIVKMAKKEANNQILNGEVPKDIKNIRENREKEREIFKREKQTVVDQNNIGKQSNEVNHDTEPVKVLDIFRKKQKEVLYDGDN